MFKVLSQLFRSNDYRQLLTDERCLGWIGIYWNWPVSSMLPILDYDIKFELEELLERLLNEGDKDN